MAVLELALSTRAGLKFRDWPASASHVLGSKECATTVPQQIILIHKVSQKLVGRLYCVQGQIRKTQRLLTEQYHVHSTVLVPCIIRFHIHNQI